MVCLFIPEGGGGGAAGAAGSGGGLFASGGIGGGPPPMFVFAIGTFLMPVTACAGSLLDCGGGGGGPPPMLVFAPGALPVIDAPPAMPPSGFFNAGDPPANKPSPPTTGCTFALFAEAF